MPDWFGIEESIREYVKDASRFPNYLAYRPGEPEVVGALLLHRHNPQAAEVHVLAVSPEYHRQGVGRALMRAVETDLRAEGVRLLQVKTMGPSRPDAGYAMTLRFYLAQGFVPLEEIHGLWPDNPCLILVKPLSNPDSSAG